MLPEIISIVLVFISDKDKIYYLSTTRTLNQTKCSVTYDDKVDISKILLLSYKNNFTHVTHETYITTIPQGVTHLTYSGTNYKLKRGDVPTSVTHLMFNGMTDKYISEYIPPVTHLTFGGLFDQAITVNIPETVTHLTFGGAFRQSICEGNIPSSVTHLKFGAYHNQHISKNIIPSSVTHIFFGWWFDHDLDNIPETVTHISLPSTYDKFVNSKVSKRIQISRRKSYLDD